MRTSIAFTLCCLSAIPGFAQLTMDNGLLFGGPAPEDRQLLGLPASTAPSAVLSARVDQTGAHRTAGPESGNTWIIQLPSLVSAPTAGTHLVLIAPAETSGPIALQVNGTGPYPLLAGPGEPIEGSAIPAGSALSVVMDGTAFQVLNGHIYERQACIEGTVAVNGNFCIEQNEHPATDLFTAISTCGSAGMRMCTWGEFVVACQRAETLGLQQITNSWEWTGDASNENGSARIVGAFSCLSGGNALVSGSTDRAYRCCYSR